MPDVTQVLGAITVDSISQLQANPNRRGQKTMPNVTEVGLLQLIPFHRLIQTHEVRKPCQMYTEVGLLQLIPFHSQAIIQTHEVRKPCHMSPRQGYITVDSILQANPNTRGQKNMPNVTQVLGAITVDSIPQAHPNTRGQKTMPNVTQVGLYYS